MRVELIVTSGDRIRQRNGNAVRVRHNGLVFRVEERPGQTVLGAGQYRIELLGSLFDK